MSGGEQRRMLFGKIILQRPNVIIMDEPTNHLDMEHKYNNKTLLLAKIHYESEYWWRNLPITWSKKN